MGGIEGGRVSILPESSLPLILWAHRWEHDKNPADFFRALTILSERGLSFELAVLGENFSQQPKVFLQSQTRLAKHIVQFGYADSFADYAHWLWRADILPVTSNQDFFGGTVVEAIYCGCFPLLPHRLAYPYLIPAEYQPHCFYHTFDELVSRLEQAITNIEQTRQFSLRDVVVQYDWQIQAEGYDRLFAELAGRLVKVQ
ncbi:glycosyltransferase [Anaerolineales bacterium HSG24]|nr:glycosyltransferase [Anaerolineales bacterium HSG24]